MHADLAKTIDDAFEKRNDISPSTKGPVREAVEAALDLLDRGKARVAERGGNGAWTVNETALTPQGEIADTSTIEKGTLLLKRRLIKQGPMSIEMDFKPDKVTGSMTMNGQAKPIDAETGGTLFADGAGTYDVIASLPLASGYSTSFRNFDVMKQKPQLKQLKVIGSESVTVPAGTFDAYKVEILSTDNDADKQTVWIAKDTRKVLKIEAVLPAGVRATRCLRVHSGMGSDIGHVRDSIILIASLDGPTRARIGRACYETGVILSSRVPEDDPEEAELSAILQPFRLSAGTGRSA